MRILFSMIEPGTENMENVFSRPSVRGIIIRDGRIAMVESRKYHYWKFPGGGMEKGESRLETLVREVREEAGLAVLVDSVKEYGNVPRRELSDKFENTVFEQENYYYLCDVEDEKVAQELDEYEAEERFTFSFIDPHRAIHDNLELDHGPKERNMIVREARVLEMLIDEGFLS